MSEEEKQGINAYEKAIVKQYGLKMNEKIFLFRDYGVIKNKFQGRLEPVYILI